MSVDSVREHLRQYGLEDRVMEFDLSSATVALAARAVGVEEARIAKTLSFRAADGGALLVVCAGDARIDNPRFKAALGMKAKMLSAEEAKELTGHSVGGVCPFALKPGVRVCLDTALQRFDMVYPAAGSAASAVRLSPEELALASGGDWVTVCKLDAGETQA